MLACDEDHWNSKHPAVAGPFLNRWGERPKCCVVDASRLLVTLTDNERRKASSLSSSRPSNRRSKRSQVACGKLRRLDRLSNSIQTRLSGGPNLTSSRRLHSCLARAEFGRGVPPQFVHFASEETPWAHFLRPSTIEICAGAYLLSSLNRQIKRDPRRRELIRRCLCPIRH